MMYDFDDPYPETTDRAGLEDREEELGERYLIGIGGAIYDSDGFVVGHERKEDDYQ